MTTAKPELLTFEKALDLVLADAAPFGAEEQPLELLLGRTLAEPVASPCDLPLFDNSAVDGYAVCGQDMESDPMPTLTLIGECKAGSPCSIELRAGTTARVFTGAPLPSETEGVAMLEDVELLGAQVQFRKRVAVGDHSRKRGEELRAGGQVLPAGTTLGPAAIAALAAAGVSRVQVYRLPTVGLLATGDELALPGTELQPGQIYESNTYGLQAALRMLGIEPAVVRSGDTRQQTAEAIQFLLERCDVVISTGGVSVGGYDLVRPALEEAGVVERFWGVAVKPGKPLYYGRTGAAAVFGLPGNPVSALTTFFLFVRPYLQKSYGRPHGFHHRPKTLTEALTKRTQRTEFVPGRICGQEVVPLTGRASHKTTHLADADGLIVFPQTADRLEPGAEVDVLRLRWGWEL